MPMGVVSALAGHLQCRGTEHSNGSEWVLRGERRQALVSLLGDSREGALRWKHSVSTSSERHAALQQDQDAAEAAVAVRRLLCRTSVWLCTCLRVGHTRWGACSPLGRSHTAVAVCSLAMYARGICLGCPSYRAVNSSMFYTCPDHFAHVVRCGKTQLHCIQAYLPAEQYALLFTAASASSKGVTMQSAVLEALRTHAHR